jgi:hypothetical protein
MVVWLECGVEVSRPRREDTGKEVLEGCCGYLSGVDAGVCWEDGAGSCEKVIAVDNGLGADLYVLLLNGPCQRVIVIVLQSREG